MQRISEGVPSQGPQELELGLRRNLFSENSWCYWGVSSDTFTFQVSLILQLHAKRGEHVLAGTCITCIDVSVEFFTPVIAKGKTILQTLMSERVDLDNPLPEDQYSLWYDWRESLQTLEDITIP